MDAHKNKVIRQLLNHLLRHPELPKDVDVERALTILQAARSDGPYLLLHRTLALEAALAQVQWQLGQVRAAAAPAVPAAGVGTAGPAPPAAPASGFLRDAAVIGVGVLGGGLLLSGIDALQGDSDAVSALPDTADLGSWLDGGGGFL